MAKKTWSFNVLIKGESIKGSHKLRDIGIEADMILVANADVLTFIPDYPHYDSTECFKDALMKYKTEAVELNGLLPEHINDILPYLNCVKYLSLMKCNKVEDLSFIEELTNLEALYIYWNQKATKVFDAKKLEKLTFFSVEDANKITDFSGLEYSNIEYLSIWGCNFLGSFTPKIAIKDFSLFTRIPKLNSLDLVLIKNEDATSDLLELAKLSNLEKIHFTDNYFTFEQFAWLKSKLPNVVGLEPIFEYENWENETVWSVIGSKKPKAVKKQEKANEYKKMYYELVDLYKNQNLPPKN